MGKICCVTTDKYYIVIPKSLLTETIGHALVAIGITPLCYTYLDVDGNQVVTDYALVGLRRPFMDCLRGFHKFSASDVHGILDKIKMDTIQLSDVYLSH